MDDYDPNNFITVLGENEYEGFVTEDDIKVTDLYHGTLELKSGAVIEFTIDKNNYDKMVNHIEGEDINV